MIIKVISTKTVSSGSVAVSAALPLEAGGRTPRLVRVAVANGSAYVKFGIGSTTATSDDILVTEPEIFDVTNYNTVSVLQYGAPAVVNFSAVDRTSWK